MSNSLKDNLFPVLSVMTGVAVTVLYAGWMERLEKPDPEVQAAITKFDQLEPSQQSRLLTQAAGFEAKDAGYKERIISIHKAVADDPSLESKLRTLHDWWGPLHPTQEAKIRGYDGDTAEWVSKVQRAYVDSHAADDVIVVRVPRQPSSTGERRSVELTEAQFESFLESIIPEDTPPELDSKLSGFEPNDSCEITLTKIIWVMGEVRGLFSQMGRPPQQKGPPNRPLMGIFDAIQLSDFRQFFDAAEWKLLSETEFNGRKDDSPNRSKEFERLQTVILISACTRGGMEYYSRVFEKKHRSAPKTLYENNDNLVDVFNNGDRGMQLDLMKMDPSRAADLLKMERLRMERERLNTEDSAVAGLIKDLTELKRRSSFGGRAGMRGPGYGGGRGGSGRSDRDDNRGGSRDRNDGRGGSRPGGREQFR